MTILERGGVGSRGTERAGNQHRSGDTVEGGAPGNLGFHLENLCWSLTTRYSYQRNFFNSYFRTVLPKAIQGI
jgi:hypothetical protein